MKRHFAVALIVICCSCVRQNHEETKLLDVPIEDVPLSMMIECRSGIVPLETNDSCLIGSIGKCLITDRRLFITDNQSLRILSFSLDNGQYMGEVSNYGRGPGEYIDIADIAADDSILYVLSSLGKKIIRYSFDGSFLGEFDTHSEPFFKIAYSQKKLYLSSEQSNQSGYDYLIMDADSGQILQRVYRFKEYNGHLFPSANSFVGRVGEELLLSRIYDGSLYCLINDGLDPKFSLQYSDYKVITSSEIKGRTVGQITEKYKSEPMFCFYRYASYTGSRYYLVAQLKNGAWVNEHFLAVDLKTEEVFRHTLGRNPDVEYPEIDLGAIVSMNDSTVYLLCDARVFRSLQIKGKIAPTLQIKEDDNPLLISYLLKR